VEISPTADPPVCKITDYGKYAFQANKKSPRAAQEQAAAAVEEVKFSGRQPRNNDIRFARAPDSAGFFGEGHKVRAMISIAGAKLAHQEVGRAKMNALAHGYWRPGARIEPCRANGGQRSRSLLAIRKKA